MSKQFDYVVTLFDNHESDPAKVTVAFTMANKALEAGHSVAMIKMIDSVHLAVPGKVDDIDIGAPFKPVKGLQEAFLDNGGKVFVCQACMVHNAIDEAHIDPRFEVVSADGVIELTMNAKGTLQLS